MAISLKNKTIFITGSSRGIGFQIALRFAKEGANIVIVGKTAETDPRMPGTIYSAAEAVEAAGGRALPLQVDIRDVESIENAINQTVKIFGGLDILVNNASALEMDPSILNTPLNRFDLVFGVNIRGAFFCAKTCLPHIRKSATPRILTISPPLKAIHPKWFKGYNLAYTISKFDMSLLTLGLAQEFAGEIAINSLWPKYVVQTSAVKLKMTEKIYQCALNPQIVADAAHLIVTNEDINVTGHFYLDADILESAGINVNQYLQSPGDELLLDFFTD